MLPQLTQLPSQRSAQQRVHTGIPDSLGKENLGKCQRITLDSSPVLTEPDCWRTRVLMRLGKDQKVLLGAHVSPFSHALPVGTKGLSNLACKGDVKFPYRRDTLTRPNSSVTASLPLLQPPLNAICSPSTYTSYFYLPSKNSTQNSPFWWQSISN